MAEIQKAGWLTDPERRERRDNPNTLLDTHVMKMLSQIDAMKEYSQAGADDMLLRLRDKALIAMMWLFARRANEVLTLLLANIRIDDKNLSVTFRIQKKSKSYKVCQNCLAAGKQVNNATTAKHCKRCDSLLPEEITVIKGESNIYTDVKTLRSTYCNYVLSWYKVCQKMHAKPQHYLFPRYNSLAGGFLWRKPFTVEHFDQNILQRLDPTMTSHFFRYGMAEKLKRLGYTEEQIAEILHMNIKTVKNYLKRKGLTDAQRQFTEDVRIT